MQVRVLPGSQIARYLPRMLSETEKKGQIAFLYCALAATRKGFVLSQPTTTARYDAIVDDGRQLLRTQIKYADDDERGAVKVDLRRKTRSATARTRTYRASEIDLLLIYAPRISKVLAVKPDIFDGKTSLQFRITPSRNRQMKRIMTADDYEW